MKAVLIGSALSLALFAASSHAQTLTDGSQLQNNSRVQIQVKSTQEEFGPVTTGSTTGSGASSSTVGLASSNRAECEVITLRSPQDNSTVIRKFFKCD